jgi:NAD(P)-dependent dehydrogenase (short-subunit alcohol dehydrogenase family)
MTQTMSGRTAIVTGAGSGIGRSAAELFAERGAAVVVSDVDEKGGAETVKRIKENGGKSMFVGCDVSNSSDVQRMVNATMDEYGRLDYAFNNAGIAGSHADTADYPEDDWRRVISVNLTGVWLCMKYEIPAMRENGGAIVNMASVLGLVAFANSGAYVAAKHGVIGITRTAAVECAGHCIRVNVVCPGFIKTPMIEGAGIQEGTDLYDSVVKLHPMGRLGHPREVAAAVVWLCSDAASFVTGHAMLIDGGYSAR